MRNLSEKLNVFTDQDVMSIYGVNIDRNNRIKVQLNQMRE
jgi:hypothetical protein